MTGTEWRVGAGPTILLVDHNLEGHAELLWGTLAAEGWLELVPLRLLTLEDAGLPDDTSDRALWRYAQEHGALLLTANRRRRGPDSLQQTIEEESTSLSLPVVTVGDADRIDERAYRRRCAERLVDIVLGWESFRGSGRIYIP